ncbi:MAG: DNA-binding response regulator [Spirochaetaceae bacterium]|nr:MAG: DNA-binding response regulator [Spirochaetaceae bacterium]
MASHEVTAVIVDDERPARERLRQALSAFPEIRVVAEADNGADAVDLIREHRPRLLFLDVQMPGLNGLEVLQRLEDHPIVIFTTAYDQYAIRAFEVHAVDYLLKPYSRERLREAVQRALAAMPDLPAAQKRLHALIASCTPVHQYLSRITVRRGGRLLVRSVHRADCFQAEDGLVFLREEEESYLVDATLNALEVELDPAAFLRIHRSVIVNLSRVEAVVPLGKGQFRVTLPNQRELPVGRTRVDELKKRLGMLQAPL